MLLNPEQEGGVPGVEPRDRVILLDLGGERVHVVVFCATDQSLRNFKKKKEKEMKNSQKQATTK
jgi:hypothetical protein